MSALRRFNIDDDDYTYVKDDDRYEAYGEDDEEYDEESEEGRTSASEIFGNFIQRGIDNILSIFKKEKRDEAYDEDDEEYDEESEESMEDAYGAVREEEPETEEYGEEASKYEEETAEKETKNGQQRESAQRRVSRVKAEKNVSDDEEYTDDEIKKYKERMGIYRYSVSDRTKARQRKTRDDAAAEYVSSPEWKYRGNVNSIIETAPWNMDDVGKIAMMIKEDNAVIMDLSRMKGERSDAVNFIDGVCFILKYRFDQIGKSSYYLAAPKGFIRSIDMGPYTGKRRGR